MTVISPPPPLGIVCLIVVVAILGAHVAVVLALLSDGCSSSIHGILRRRSVVCGIDNKFVVVRLCDLVDLHLFGLDVNIFVLLLLGFVLLR